MNIVILSSHFTGSKIGIHDKAKISFVMQILFAFQMNPWMQLILMKIVNDSETQMVII